MQEGDQQMVAINIYGREQVPIKAILHCRIDNGLICEMDLYIQS